VRAGSLALRILSDQASQPPASGTTCRDGLTPERPDISFSFRFGVLQNMSGFRSLRRGRHAQLSRVLTHVVLVLIAYGSSVGIAHRHDALSSGNPQPLASAASDSLVAQDLSHSSNSPVKPGECQICQFRQSLSNGSIFTAVLMQAPTASSPVVAALAISVSSTTQTTSQGRAPPVIS
jgi:hypothetical protein